MKNFVYKYITVLLAFLVFYTGSGITVYKYCCTNCKLTDCFLGQKHGCNISTNLPSHKDDRSHKCPDCCSNTKNDSAILCKNANPVKCSVSRISPDINFHQAKLHIVLPILWVISNTIFNTDNSSSILKGIHFSSYSAKDLPCRDINSYLAFIQVFII